MTKYLRVKETYCGFISVQYFAIIASCITLGTQLSFSVFFLIYGQMWGLIPLFATIGSHLFFMITIARWKSTISMSIFSGIEIAFAFTMLGMAVWILSWILDPQTSFLYSFCTDTLKYTNCYGRTQIDSLIWGCLFIIFFFVSVIMLPVYRNTWRNIKATRKSSSVYIERDNNQSAAVQPIFNINAAPPTQPVQPQILFPQQFMQTQGMSMQNPPQRPEQLFPGQVPSIMTPAGTIQLNLYTIQLPNGNSALLSPTTPVIEQLSSNFSDSVSQAEQVLERL